jgi:DNA topoisomerase-3
MTVVVVAEKPSVGRDLARVLGATQRGEGLLSGNGYVVTWAIGHLVGLAEPEGIRPEWKRWSRATLPMLPQEWPLQVLEGTRAQFAVVAKALTAKDVTGVICATDAGREGELIFRFIYEAAGCRKPVQRLWISSLTDGAIRAGFSQLRPASDFDGLAAAALGRSRADWLVGMNLSRAYGLALDLPLSVGRVQTPTLALLVERELAIRDFVAEDFLEVVATFSPREGASYRGTWHRPGTHEHPRRLPASGEEASAVVARAQVGRARIAAVSSKTKKLPPPLLYDLTELQRHLNRLFGFSAQRSLDLAQALYEKHKLISYPRTDSRHLSTEGAGTLGAVTRAIRAPYEAHLAPGTGERLLSRRFVDDAQVSDHHAIIPTAVVAHGLSADEQKVYALICRRLLQAWHDDFTWAATEVVTEILTPGVVDTYRSHGTAIEQQGWKVLDVGGVKPPKEKGAGSEDEEDGLLPAGLEQGQSQQVLDATSVPRRTRPPPRLNDATLLTAMETASKTLDERELSEAMKEHGLGTPATRASIIETLLSRAYVSREGKSLVATEKGVGLIAVVDAEVRSPAMTGAWEARLQRIAKRQGGLGEFMKGIEAYVESVVGRIGVSTLPAVASSSPPPPPLPLEKREPQSLEQLLHGPFGFPSYRPHQQAACEAAAAGEDVLLVMPTGAGKSLCYQLPGLARGGTTLVVSPLIALMEDQVAGLQAKGLRAARIHSGRGRLESRRVCNEYLDGRLDYLFIAPERLGVAGFPELLARRVPTLVAIEHVAPALRAVHVPRPERAPFEIAVLVEDEERMVAGAREMPVVGCAFCRCRVPASTAPVALARGRSSAPRDQQAPSGWSASSSRSSQSGPSDSWTRLAPSRRAYRRSSASPDHARAGRHRSRLHTRRGGRTPTDEVGRSGCGARCARCGGR